MTLECKNAKKLNGFMISLDLSLFAIALIIGILTFFMQKVYFNSVSKIKEGRESLISKNEKKVSEIVSIYEEKLSFLNDKLSQARIEASEIKENIRNKTQTEIERIINEAKALSEKMLKEELKKIDNQKREAIKKLEKEADEISEMIVESFLKI
ncbi:MAG: hypothetical protein AB1410_07180 [Acidobacteriota bacterium]